MSASTPMQVYDRLEGRMRNATPSPPQGDATFGEIDKSAWRSDVARPAPDFERIGQSSEFRELRGRVRRFTFPMTAAFLAWYLVYVVLAAYFPEFMGTRVFGAVNIGLLLGLGQFASTVLIIVWYLRYAAREIDPRVHDLYVNVTGEEPR
ncbi:DUF485 domain-containing protein [Saccharopolyspora halophila]|uniref:DUF485 domain-containing protein n=1 Tax=Saccharopolyspora halophila TaxID=405551 RepID=UPI0031E472D7